MSDRGAPRHGRHASPDEGWGEESPSWGAGSSFWADEAPEREALRPEDRAWQGGHASRDLTPPTVERSYPAPPRRDGSEWAPGSGRRPSGLLDRWADETGPMPEWCGKCEAGSYEAPMAGDRTYPCEKCDIVIRADADASTTEGPNWGRWYK